jgi:hypothetical protein
MDTKNKNIDAIILKKRRVFKAPRPPAAARISPEPNNFFAASYGLTRRLLRKKNFILFAAVMAISFAGGSYFTWSAENSLAENGQAEKVSAPASVPALSVVEYAPEGETSVAVAPDVWLSMSFDQLEAFLENSLTTPEVKYEELLADRKYKLKVYLEAKNSPLIEIADTLAELKHWKLVLAISNSESSLGKRCYKNNCSGIGVMPGHPYWRDYESKAAWAKDLDRLIEKRYKDWSLKEMNGVYNKPGSSNWLAASTQIVEELREKGIE